MGRQDNGHVATNSSSSSSSSSSFSLCTHDNTNRRWHMEQKIDTRPMRRDTSVTKVSQPLLDVPRSPRPGSRHQPGHGIFNLSLHEDPPVSFEWPAALFLRRWTASYSSSSSFLRSSSSSPSWPFFVLLLPSRRFHSSFVRVTDCYGARRSIDTRSIPCKQLANAIGVEGDACRKRRTTVSIRCIREG